MQKCYIDTEVKSKAPLKLVGAAKYFEHSSTQTIIVTYQLNSIVETQVWDVTFNSKIPSDLAKAASSSETLFFAFNASFDRAALENLGIRIPLKRWRCLMVMALSLGFQGSLDQVLERFEIPYRKEREGSRLIRKFCMPQPKNRIIRHWDRHNAPEDWAKFIHYGLTDTEVLVPLHEKISAYSSSVKWSEWAMDQEINHRGLPIDMTLVEKALIAVEEEKACLISRMQEVSGLDNPNSKAQVKVWLRDTQGLHLANMQKATVALALTNTKLSEDARKILRLNQQLSKTSTSKWNTLDRAVCHDGRIRYTHQYLGAARTGRDAHRLFQPGNLPRGMLEDAVSAANLLKNYGREAIDLVYGDVMEVLSSIIRCAITAPKGEILSVVDLTGIEGRVLPWQCDFQKKLEQIAAGRDMYKVAAEDVLGIPYDRVTDAERFKGKILELSMGYQGAIGALNTMATQYGAAQFSDSEGLPLVRAWRAKNKPIVRYWYACDKAVRLVIQDPGKAKRVHHVTFTVEKDFLFILLPSGRRLAYYKPEYDSGGFSYMGLDSYTHKWVRTESFGGKIVENITQAIARDIFFYGAKLYGQQGGKVILRVHDELVASVPKTKVEHELKKLTRCMTTVPDWIKGLPLDAKGFITKRYIKK